MSALPIYLRSLASPEYGLKACVRTSKFHEPTFHIFCVYAHRLSFAFFFFYIKFFWEENWGLLLVAQECWDSWLLIKKFNTLGLFFKNPAETWELPAGINPTLRHFPPRAFAFSRQWSCGKRHLEAELKIRQKVSRASTITKTQN